MALFISRTLIAVVLLAPVATAVARDEIVSPNTVPPGTSRDHITPSSVVLSTPAPLKGPSLGLDPEGSNKLLAGGVAGKSKATGTPRVDVRRMRPKKQEESAETPSLPPAPAPVPAANTSESFQPVAFEIAVTSPTPVEKPTPKNDAEPAPAPSAAEPTTKN